MSGTRPAPRLLVLASTYPRWPGDHEPGFVHELCRRLARQFQVTVLTSRSPGAADRATVDGVEIVRYAYAPRRLETLVYGGGIATHLKRSPWKWLLVPGFVLAQRRVARRLAREGRAELVHAHWLLPQGVLARGLFRRGLTRAYVVTSHGGDLYGLRGRLLRRIKQRVAADAAALTVVSSGMRDEAARQGITAKIMQVMPMGADLQRRFTPDPAISRVPGRVLFAGRLVEKKGLVHLLAAMPEVLARRPDAHLVVAGYGPLRGELETQAQALGIAHAVRFLGAVGQDRLPGHYRRAAVLAAPFVRAASGDLEGLPVVLMEAIGCGCPVIASDIPGVRDLLDEDFADWRVPPGDPRILAQAIVRMLDDGQAMEPRALELRARCLARIDWDSVARGYAALLMRALDDSGRA